MTRSLLQLMYPSCKCTGEQLSASKSSPHCAAAVHALQRRNEITPSRNRPETPATEVLECSYGSPDYPGLEVQGPRSAKPATARRAIASCAFQKLHACLPFSGPAEHNWLDICRSLTVSCAEHKPPDEEDDWQPDWKSTSESEGLPFLPWQ